MRNRFLLPSRIEQMIIWRWKGSSFCQGSKVQKWSTYKGNQKLQDLQVQLSTLDYAERSLGMMELGFIFLSQFYHKNLLTGSECQGCCRLALQSLHRIIWQKPGTMILSCYWVIAELKPIKHNSFLLSTLQC